MQRHRVLTLAGGASRVAGCFLHGSLRVVFSCDFLGTGSGGGHLYDALSWFSFPVTWVLPSHEMS